MFIFQIHTKLGLGQGCQVSGVRKGRRNSISLYETSFI
jgi:hypothetical protein